MTLRFFSKIYLIAQDLGFLVYTYRYLLSSPATRGFDRSFVHILLNGIQIG